MGGQQINWRAEERRFHGSTFCRFLRVSAFHDRALRNAPKTWGPLLRVTQFQARPLPSVRQTETAWDGKSTWINIYYGRCCFRQVLFRGNLLWLRRCYGNNPLTEVFLQSVWFQSSKKLHVGLSLNSSCFLDTGNISKWRRRAWAYGCSHTHFNSLPLLHMIKEQLIFRLHWSQSE